MDNELEIISQMIIEGDIEGVASAIQASPQVLTQFYQGDSVLHLAADNANNKIVDTILHSGCDPNILNEEGETALHLAIYRGYKDIVKTLLIFKADPHIKNFQGKDAFSYAQEYTEFEILEILENNECDLVSDEWLYSQTSNESLKFNEEIPSFLPKLISNENSAFALSDGQAEESTFNSFLVVSKKEKFRRSKTKKNFNKEEIFDFLNGLKLRKYFQAFIRFGFDNFECLVNQMKTPAKVDEWVLENSGIFERKDREIILTELMNRAEDVNLQFRVDGLYEFLEDLDMSKYYFHFTENGFLRLEDIFSVFRKTENFGDLLRDDLRILKMGHRLRIIGAIQLFEGTQKGCDLIC